MIDWGFIVALLAILLLTAALVFILRSALRMKRPMVNRSGSDYATSSKPPEQTTKTDRQPEEEGLYEQEQLAKEETPSLPLPSSGTGPRMHGLALEPKPTPQQEQEPIPEPKRKWMVGSKHEPTLQSKRGSATSLIEVSVEELNAAYKTGEVAADANFRNKTLEVTGVVDRIVVRRLYDNYYIILISAARKEQWNVRCTFEKKDEPELNRLTKGQIVTVQGRYEGYKLNIILSDCILVG